ncbi:trbL/VirB6 plasmid conjugal transfer family protein (plasmid) [Yersinia pestis]|uniref:Conjugal transfer protein n=1 Tax=Yersinia pestis Java 9 TaxID=880632 RepID=E8PS70_YERPE|nr:type IV secretion system protein [Yersinia pestis]ADW66870.1 conjugal transfer protein [Yersinia pestis Java 9]AJJ37951.1 trbL/VirB6 plasmid conjugal transfer family protein [Yersinia pestis]ROZ98595.1 type IV secretion system protein [Yersinia pestis]
MAQGFFAKYNSTVMDSVDKISASYQSQFASDIMTLAAASVTLFVLWKGYQTLAGKTQTPLPDLAWDLSKFAIIITFITNADGYLDAATNALQGIKDGFSGGVSVWNTLDNLWKSTQNLGAEIYALDKSTYVKDQGWLAQTFVWGGSLILMAVSVVVFLTADVTMKLLVITAPIFIFCLMFGFLRTMFNNWLQNIFSSILTVLFATLVIRIAMDYQGEILAQAIRAAQKGSVNLVSTGAMGFMAGLLGAVLVLIAKSFASQLAGAGVDGTLQGAAMMGFGASGMMAGKGLMTAGRAGIGLGIGLTGNKGMQSLSGKTGNLLGRGTRSAAEWAGDKAYQKLAPTGTLGMEARRLASLEKARARNAS